MKKRMKPSEEEVGRRMSARGSYLASLRWQGRWVSRGQESLFDDRGGSEPYILPEDVWEEMQNCPRLRKPADGIYYYENRFVLLEDRAVPFGQLREFFDRRESWYW